MQLVFVFIPPFYVGIVSGEIEEYNLRWCLVCIHVTAGIYVCKATFQKVICECEPTPKAKRITKYWHRIGLTAGLRDLPLSE